MGQMTRERRGPDGTNGMEAFLALLPASASLVIFFTHESDEALEQIARGMGILGGVQG